MFSRLKNASQPRKMFRKQELAELCSSILEFGVIQPIIVRRVEGRCHLIAGERRLRAAIMAGLDRIPAIIREADEKDSDLIALVENVQRENLNYMEEAVAYKSLMDEYGLTQGETFQKSRQATIHHFQQNQTVEPSGGN